MRSPPRLASSPVPRLPRRGLPKGHGRYSRTGAARPAAQARVQTWPPSPLRTFLYSLTAWPLLGPGESEDVDLVGLPCLDGILAIQWAYINNRNYRMKCKSSITHKM